MGRKSSLPKGKDKVIDGKASSAGKRKRDGYDEDKTGGRKRKGVLQFVDDAAYEVDDDDDDDFDFDFSDDSDFFDEDFLEEFGSNVEIKNEPVRTPQPPVIKEEELDGEELEKMLRERYRPGSSFVAYAEDSDEKKRLFEQDTLVPSLKDPTIWKVKCTVGRERHSTFCLMQKYIDLLALGTKLQIISAFSLDHVKGYIYIEADKQSDVYEACKGLCSIYSSRVAPVPKNEVSHLIAVRSKSSGISEGMWARVKSGIYKGDLAQVVAVNDSRKKVTVKLIPRIDLQAIADKFGGGVAAKKGVIAAPRLISSTELEDFRPLIQYRKDRDTNLMLEILDGKMLKDGYLYKKVGTDSLSYWGVMPTEAELLKFEPSKSDGPQDVEWLTQLYGDRKKKRIINDFKVGQKGGEKGEGSSSSSMENNFEVDDLVFFGRNDFGIIIGKEKDDSFKIMKDGSERPVVVSIQLRELKRASFDRKLFTVKDQLTNTISVGDMVRVLDGPLKDRQGIVKQIYKGVVFLYDQSEQDNSGYLCVKGQMCEKITGSDGVSNEKGSEPGPSGFADFSSSPKSPLSPEKSWRAKDDNCSFKHDDKDGMFSVGQSLRIRVGPLKGYLCRVVAIRRSDVTVKLDSRQKILTVKSEHLAEVHGKSSITSLGVDGDSAKPFDLLGTQDGSQDWMVQGATETEGNTENAGASSSAESSWPAFPAVAGSGQDDGWTKPDGWAKGTSTAGATSAVSDGWGKKVESHQESTEKVMDDPWGSVQKQEKNDDSGRTSWSKQDAGSSWGKQSDADPETDWKKQDGGANKTDRKTSWSQQDAGSDGGSSWGAQAGVSSWGKQSDANAETGWKKQDGVSNKTDSKTSWSQQGAGSSWKKSDGEGGSSWTKQSDATAETDWKKKNDGSGWKKPDSNASWSQQDAGFSSKKSEGEGGSWSKQSDAKAENDWKKQDGGSSSWGGGTDLEGSWGKPRQFDGGRGSGGRRGRGGWRGGRDQSGRGRSFNQGQSSSWTTEGEGNNNSSNVEFKGNQSSWNSSQELGWGKVNDDTSIAGNRSSDFQSGGGWNASKPSNEGWSSGWNKNSASKEVGGSSGNQSDWDKRSGESGSKQSAGWDNKITQKEAAGNSSAWNSKAAVDNEDTSIAGNQSSDFQSGGGWNASKPSNEGWSSGWNKNSVSKEVGGPSGNQSDWDKKSGESGSKQSAGWDNKITHKESAGNSSAWNSKSAVEQDANGKNQNDPWSGKRTSDGGSSTGWGQSNLWKSGKDDAVGNQDSWSSKSNWNSGSGFGNNDQQSDSYGDRGRGGSWRGGRDGSDRGGYGGRGGSDRGGFGGRGGFRGRGDRGGFRGRGSDGGGFRGRGHGRRDESGDWQNRTDSQEDKAYGWSKESGSDAEGFKSNKGSWSQGNNDRGSWKTADSRGNVNDGGWKKGFDSEKNGSGSGTSATSWNTPGNSWKTSTATTGGTSSGWGQQTTVSEKEDQNGLGTSWNQGTASGNASTAWTANKSKETSDGPSDAWGKTTSSWGKGNSSGSQGGGQQPTVSEKEDQNGMGISWNQGTASGNASTAWTANKSKETSDGPTDAWGKATNSWGKGNSSGSQGGGKQTTVSGKEDQNGMGTSWNQGAASGNATTAWTANKSNTEDVNKSKETSDGPSDAWGKATNSWGKGNSSGSQGGW
ncbi:uncharacterized protein LOC107762737 isoform X2 [Nicotiana tabacum]|uniref:Uncharacterized protein LOC107762737 isoform X2 n=1 Tax=Nicotiana tabacum TaxID=4097 RepID=A0AC58SHW4_TOBAC